MLMRWPLLRMPQRAAVAIRQRGGHWIWHRAELLLRVRVSDCAVRPSQFVALRSLRGGHHAAETLAMVRRAAGVQKNIHHTADDKCDDDNNNDDGGRRGVTDMFDFRVEPKPNVRLFIVFVVWGVKRAF